MPPIELVVGELEGAVVGEAGGEAAAEEVGAETALEVHDVAGLRLAVLLLRLEVERCTGGGMHGPPFVQVDRRAEEHLLRPLAEAGVVLSAVLVASSRDVQTVAGDKVGARLRPAQADGLDVQVGQPGARDWSRSPRCPARGCWRPAARP